jgi:hypothetical protein
MAEYRRYTRKQKAEVVAAAALTTVQAVAESTGIPRTTIDYWLDDPQFVELRSKTRDEVGERMWATIQIGIDEVAKGLVSDAPLRDKATAVGILYDKHALLTGGATARSENRDITGTLSDSDVADTIRAAEDYVGSRRSGTAPSAEAAPEG